MTGRNSSFRVEGISVITSTCYTCMPPLNSLAGIFALLGVSYLCETAYFDVMKSKFRTRLDSPA